MGVIVIDTLQRGGAGTAPFPVIAETDSKTSYVTVADISSRDAIPEWKRMSNMQCYVISTGLAYRLGTDLTIAGQVWTQIPGVGSGFQLLSEKGQPDGYAPLDSSGKIDPTYIQDIYSNNSFVAASEAAMLALTTQTGDVVTRTDSSQIFVKLNNNAPPTVIGDFAELLFPGAVTSVNGESGAVSITITNLLAWGTNQTLFEAAVAAAPAVADNGSAITINQNNIAQLQLDVAALQDAGATIKLFDSGTDYTAGESFVVFASDTTKELYRCIQSTNNPSPDPTDGAFWERIGDYYTKSQIDSLFGALDNVGYNLTRSWNWSEGVSGGGDTYVDFIIDTATTDGEIYSLSSCILMVNGIIQDNNFTVETTTYVNDTIRITASSGDQTAGTRVLLWYNRAGISLPVINASDVLYDSSEETGGNLVADKTDLQAAVKEVRDRVNAPLPSLGAFNPAMTFDGSGQHTDWTPTSSTTQTFTATGIVDGNTRWVKIITDGTVTFAAGSGCELLSGSLGLLQAGTYKFGFGSIFGAVQIVIPGTSTSTNAPSLTSATIEDLTDSILDLVFNEAVDISINGWSISTDGAPLSISSVSSGSGTTTPKFQLSRSILSSETITISYNSTTGNTVSSSTSIELVSITNRSVTNNVGLTQLNSPTIQAASSVNSDGFTVNWLDTNSSPNEASFLIEYDTVNTFDSVNYATTTAVQDATSKVLTGLGAETLWYYRVTAVGDGSLTSDSDPSGTGSETTSSAAFDIGSIGATKLKVWLEDATDSANIVHTTDPGYVQQWTDSSGNAKHATQSTLANKPIVHAGGVGFNLTSGDGGDDSTNDGLSISQAINSGTQQDILIVVDMRAVGGLNRLMVSEPLLFQNYDNPVIGLRIYPNTEVGSHVPWNTGLQLVHFSFDGAGNGTIRINDGTPDTEACGSVGGASTVLGNRVSLVAGLRSIWKEYVHIVGGTTTEVNNTRDELNRRFSIF